MDDGVSLPPIFRLLVTHIFQIEGTPMTLFIGITIGIWICLGSLGIAIYAAVRRSSTGRK